MPPQQKTTVEPGDRFGSLTVLSEEGRNRHGHRRYLVRCGCGKEYIVPRASLFRAYPRCRKCAEATHYREKLRKYHLWNVVGHWLILTEPEMNSKGKLVCQGMCLSCGNESTIYPAEKRFRKSWQCAACPPNYYFTVKDNIAEGVLPGGELFLIDAEDIGRAEKFFWHKDKKGYVISTPNQGTAIWLHHFIMGFQPQKKVHIDHINRNRLDCRKCNLRIVTAQQNSMNKSIQKNSSTGYAGVTFLKHSGRYMARIGLNNRRIELGCSKDPVICAQMYNYASELIFGEFAGHRNDVPEPPGWVKQRVEERCRPYMAEAMIATQPCDSSSVQMKGD